MQNKSSTVTGESTASRVQASQIEYKTSKGKIEVYVGGKLWQVWRRENSTEKQWDTAVAIADGRISPPVDLNQAAEGQVKP